ncbi:MAG: glycosyltransferase [Oligoflexia bacterium]|nr:glycosyltransferase [Oligoflexia bacterium]MBF0364959.1 glycosyltransferase [Oligoflexia bacterium]
MKILFEHNGILPVKKYGGTERILYWHMKELIRQGHEVYLIGNPKSQLAHTGIKLIPELHSRSGDFRSLIPKEIDVVHLFYTPSFALDHPLVVTIEGNGKVGEEFHHNTVFISKKHAENHAGKTFVYNGIDLSEYPFPKQLTLAYPDHPLYWQHFLFLAKAKWSVKNLEGASKACKENKKHLHIAGGRVFSFSSTMHSYGMVDQQKKLQLLQKVSALIFPVRWHEPFGIAIIEAMAMGVPVIGTPYGSLPELISSDSGVICKTYEELVTTLKEFPQRHFSPLKIRKYLEEKFSIAKMTSDYLALYKQVKSGEKIHQQKPHYTLQNSAEELLPF